MQSNITLNTTDIYQIHLHLLSSILKRVEERTNECNELTEFKEWIQVFRK